MKTRWTLPGLALLLFAAVNCGKDDPLPGPPDAAAKDGGSSDAVKGDVEPAVDLAPATDSPAPDVVPVISDTAIADTGNPGVGDTPVNPVGADANPVRLDGGITPRDASPSDLLADSPADVRPDSVTQDAPLADASVIDAETEG